MINNFSTVENNYTSVGQIIKVEDGRPIALGQRGGAGREKEE